MRYTLKDKARRYVWFAWRPVITIDNELVWLEKVERIIEYNGVYTTIYRVIEKKNDKQVQVL